LSTVGALRVPVRSLIPFDVASGLSVNAFSAAWQVAHDTLPVELNRLSSKSFFPSATLSAVIGLSAGIGTVGRPSGGAAGDPARASLAIASAHAALAIPIDENRSCSPLHDVPFSWSCPTDARTPCAATIAVRTNCARRADHSCCRGSKAGPSACRVRPTSGVQPKLRSVSPPRRARVALPFCAAPQSRRSGRLVAHVGRVSRAAIFASAACGSTAPALHGPRRRHHRIR
jgi:hypothetical protein